MLVGACHGLLVKWAGDLAAELDAGLHKILTLHNPDPKTAEKANAREVGFKEFEATTQAIHDGICDKRNLDLADVKKLANHQKYLVFTKSLESAKAFLLDLRPSLIIMWYQAEDLPEGKVWKSVQQVRAFVNVLTKPMLDTISLPSVIDEQAISSQPGC